MKIVIVNPSYDATVRDAAALLSRYHSLTGWCESLAAAGMHVTAVQRFHREAKIARGGVEYLFYGDRPDRSPPVWSRACHQLVADARPDLVHVNGLDYSAQTWALKRVLPARTAIVVQDHASGEPVQTGLSMKQVLGRAVRRHLMRAADGFLFTSTMLAEGWRRAGLIHAQQPVYPVLEASTSLRSVPRGQARAETRIRGDPAILWVGRLNANKDPLTVVDGFARCLDRLPAATLSMIFAADDLLPGVRHELERSPALRSHVRLLGQVSHDRMAAYYSAADIFAIGSHHEGSGYALLEACACGVAPVVTDIPAFRAITGDGAIGALWPAGDAGALADALVRVASERKLEARERVLAYFDAELSWRAVARDAALAYADACARRRGETA